MLSLCVARFACLLNHDHPQCMYLHVTEEMRIRECPDYRKGFCPKGELLSLRFPSRKKETYQNSSHAPSRARPRLQTQARPKSHVSRLSRRVLQKRQRLPLRTVRWLLFLFQTFLFSLVNR